MTGELRTLLGQQLVVCVGSGGVGKTTTAAALAVAGARARRRTAVITVDPARRLKDSLGLTDLSGQPRRLRLPGTRAAVDALELDTKHTFDALIARVAPSEEIARRILTNRLYQELSNGLGGSAEYMAMEKLHELLSADAYQLVVVDTPPGARARDLLSAPVRLSALLASSAVTILKAPASILSGPEAGLTRTTLRVILRALERWTGVQVLADLSSFAGDFEHLVDGFRSRAGDIERALREPSASFILVTTPEPETVDATIELHRDLREARFPVAGIVANRVHRFPDLPDDAGKRMPKSLLPKLLANYADFAALSRRDRVELARLADRTALPLLAVLPVLERPPSSIQGLLYFAALLEGQTGTGRGQLLSSPFPA